jgi:hypothetical protein
MSYGNDRDEFFGLTKRAPERGNRSTARTADSKPANVGSNPASPAISEVRIPDEWDSLLNGVCCE